VVPFVAAREAAAYARGRAEGEVATISHFGLHRSGVKYEDLEAEVARLRAELAGARADLEYLRSLRSPPYGRPRWRRPDGGSAP
jgi:hypothetical protein